MFIRQDGTFFVEKHSDIGNNTCIFFMNMLIFLLICKGLDRAAGYG